MVALPRLMHGSMPRYSHRSGKLVRVFNIYQHIDLNAVAEVFWLPIRAMSPLSLTFATLKVDDISVVTYARLG